MNTIIWTLIMMVLVGYALGLVTVQIWNIKNKMTKYLGYNAILGREEYRVEDYYG